MLKKIFYNQKMNCSSMQIQIKQDLENLFNHKQTHLQIPKHLEELKKSAVFYGCDTNSFSPQQLLKIFDHAISQFEPRLTNYHIIAAENFNNTHEIHLEVTAIINTQQQIFKLQFEIIINQVSKHVKVL